MYTVHGTLFTEATLDRKAVLTSDRSCQQIYCKRMKHQRKTARRLKKKSQDFFRDLVFFQRKRRIR
eukprot:jgi/Antlo1/403/890